MRSRPLHRLAQRLGCVRCRPSDKPCAVCGRPLRIGDMISPRGKARWRHKTVTEVRAYAAKSDFPSSFAHDGDYCYTR